MARRNHPKHPRFPALPARYDMDYISLPEHPNYSKIIVRPLKTIYVNLDADFNADEEYVARSLNDKMMRLIAERV